MDLIAILIAFISYKMDFSAQYYSGMSYTPNEALPLIIVMNKNSIVCGIESMGFNYLFIRAMSPHEYTLVCGFVLMRIEYLVSVDSCQRQPKTVQFVCGFN